MEIRKVIGLLCYPKVLARSLKIVYLRDFLGSALI